MIYIFILFVIILGTFVLNGNSAAPYLPTLPKQRKHQIGLVDFKDGDVVYDLGCGDGSLLFDAVRKNNNIKAIGFELALLPYLIGLFRKSLGRHKNVTIKFRDLFGQKINDADIIFIYLLEKSYSKLISKFKKEIKDNCLVVISTWPLKSIYPHKVVRKDGFSPVYFYKGHQFK